MKSRLFRSRNVIAYQIKRSNILQKQYNRELAKSAKASQDIADLFSCVLITPALGFGLVLSAIGIATATERMVETQMKQRNYKFSNIFIEDIYSTY